MFKALIPAAILLTLAGCGLSGDTPLVELSDNDRTSLCEDLADFTEVSLSCDGIDITLSPTPVDECVADYQALPQGCAATVDDARACIEVVKTATCDTDFLNSACATLVDESCTPAQ